MADISITKFRVQIPRSGATPSTPGFAQSEGQDPVNPPGSPTGIYVPYLGATGSVNLGEFGLTTGFVTFDTTPTGTPTSQGTAYWDDARQTVALIMNGTIQHIGQDTFYYVKNSSGAPIPKGTCVRFAGTDGASGHLLIEPFLANGTYSSNVFMGVTAETIANGSFGQVMHFGELDGINTSSYAVGALLYASTTVAGGFQTTVPVAPNNIVLVAAAINSKNNGTIAVRPTYGSNINNDEGVKIVSPSNGQTLVYNDVTGLWENGTITTADKVSYDQSDSKNATERNQARVNIGSTSATPQVIATAGAINDLAVTSNHLVFTGASVVLSGIVAGLDGEEFTILNASGTNLELLSQSVLSTAGNRFASGVIVPNLSTVRIKYRTTTARWILENVGINDNRYVRKDVADTKEGLLTLNGGLNMQTAGNGNVINAVVQGANNTGHTFGEGGILAFRVGRYNANPVLGRGVTAFANAAVFNGSFYVCSADLGTQWGQFSSVDGTLSHSRSNSSNKSTRRDELYLNYSQTVATAGTINDLALNADCKLLILTAADDLTGAIAVDNTRLLRIEARGGNRIIRDQNVGSVAANRFALGADLTINAGEVYQFIYTDSRWRRVL